MKYTHRATCVNNDTAGSGDLITINNYSTSYLLFKYFNSYYFCYYYYY